MVCFRSASRDPWKNVDTLLTARYVLIDDHVIVSGQRRPRFVPRSVIPCDLPFAMR